MKRVFIKKGRKKSIMLKHPWIFSGAIEKIDPDIKAGDMVLICDNSGKPLALGYINPYSQITIRIISWDIEKEKSWKYDKLIIDKLKNAIDLRINYFNLLETNAFRLVNSEADLLPGLIIDKYDKTLVIQILTLGMDRFKDVIVNFLLDYLSPKCIYERSDTYVRKKEGLQLIKGPIHGNPPEKQEILENGYKFLVDIKNGQKTGFYLDQRDNRKELLKFCREKIILNCFSYTGAFSVYGLKGGAKHVINLEASNSAIELAKEIMHLNKLDKYGQTFIAGNVFEILRAMKKEGKKFDLIILDPPKFAHTQSNLDNAIRGYKEINLQAMQLLKPGGILFTFTCSGTISHELFSKIITWAAMDSKRIVQVIKRLTHPIDHPYLTSFLESEYLKGLICKIF